MSKTSCAFTSETHKPWLERHLETTQSSSNSMIAPQDCDVRQSGRVLELQNRDLWIVLALLHSRDHSWDAIQKLPWKVIREIEGQRGQDRGCQEAEDSEK